MRPGSFPVRPPVETATARCPSESRATAPTVSAPCNSSCRLRSVMKMEGSHISRPCSRANRDAPAAASKTCRPSSITATARSIGCRTSRRQAAPPARSPAPSMTPASSSTSPSLFSVAPMPALSSGSSSIWRTAATAATRAPPSILPQPASRARSTAAWRSAVSEAGMGPAPPWTMRAGRAAVRFSKPRLPASGPGARRSGARRCAGRRDTGHAGWRRRARGRGVRQSDGLARCACPSRFVARARAELRPPSSNGDATAAAGSMRRFSRRFFARRCGAPARRPDPCRRTSRSSPAEGGPR